MNNKDESVTLKRWRSDLKCERWSRREQNSDLQVLHDNRLILWLLVEVIQFADEFISFSSSSSLRCEVRVSSSSTKEIAENGEKSWYWRRFDGGRRRQESKKFAETSKIDRRFLSVCWAPPIVAIVDVSLCLEFWSRWNFW